MDGLALVSAASPSSSQTAYVSWEEMNVSSDKGRREVHYYLKRRDGVSDLAVIGKEKSLRHMSYHFAIKNRSLFFSSTSFYKLKSRREVIYWLNSVVSDSSYRGLYCSVDGIWNGKNVKSMDFGALKDLQSQKLVQEEFLWLGSSWTCKRKRKHYPSFRRRGVIISVHNFVYVLAEEDKRLVAYLEDLYEDSIGNKMVVVRWFHKIDESLVLCILRKFQMSQSILCSSHLYAHCADDQNTDRDVDDAVGIRPRKRYRRSKDDDVVHLHLNGISESMDVSYADPQDLLNSKKGNDLFSFQVDKAKQYSSQHLIVGSQVEVLAQDSGMRGCWFRARIIKKHKNKLKVQYQDIQDAADEANKLEEWILSSKVAAPDEVGVRMSGRTAIRPPSRYARGIASCIGVGSVVDVWWHDGWWEGLVVQKHSEDKFCVYFPGEKRESVFDIGDIRQSQEWVGNRWIDIKERNDLVSTILRVGKQDANFYDCNFDKNTISESGQSGKDIADCSDSPVRPGGDRPTGARLVPDLSKDDWLSQLKWKSSGKRKRVTSTHLRKLNCSRNVIKSSARPVSSERFLIPASLKVDNDNCKYIGDPLFSSSVVPPLTSMVMTR
ncbi:hypothetical protein V6N13_099351 [Hibiscus sabdariffa]|uniref:BAH domain-containing protein n=1 Tax=Hibiscus sabdariffa TaxID=183260 RepID=A0ABR2PZX2_9ROSI